MIKRRRREVPFPDMLIINQTTRHHNNHWLHSHCDPLPDSMVFADKQDLRHFPTRLRSSPRSLSVSRSRIRNHRPVSGGQLALLFCLILLHQPCVSLAVEDINDVASSSVNILHRQQFSLHQARRDPEQVNLWHLWQMLYESTPSPPPRGKFSAREDLRVKRTGSFEVIPLIDFPIIRVGFMPLEGEEIHLTGLLQSEQTIPHNLRLTKGGTLYPFPSSLSQDFDSMDLSSHSNRNQDVDATRMKKLQPNAWYNGSQFLPPPRQIEYIVRQWHRFRQTRRQNRRNQRKQAEVKEETQRRRPSRRQPRNRTDQFNKIVLRREAQALQKASSFDEFKRILLRSNAKSIGTQKISNESFLDAGILPEVSGGVVFHSQPHSKAKKAMEVEDKNRNISKRSLDLSDENLIAEHEVGDYSEDELRSAYESYNEFLSKACKPVNKTLCTKTFFPNMHKNKSTLFLPPGLYIQRCDNPIWSTVYGFGSSVNSYQVMFDQASRMRSKSALKALCDAADRMNPNMDTRNIYAADAGGSCTCALPEEECLPTEVRLKTSPVVVYNTAEGTTTTEVIALTEHMGCQCKRRCDNRQCVPPLKLNKYTYDDCYCYCEKGDTRCESLLEGQEKFTEKDFDSFHGEC
ncbi:hypothetical protein ACTXT7_007862 [Hymenolepis weldensis]